MNKLAVGTWGAPVDAVHPPTTWLTLRDAVISRADARCPAARVIEYMSLPWPVTLPDGDRQAVVHDPYEQPRNSVDDIAWMWLEQARVEIRQALFDGKLTAVHQQEDGFTEKLPAERWRDPTKAADLKQSRPVWLRRREGLLIAVFDFERWMARIRGSIPSKVLNVHEGKTRDPGQTNMSRLGRRPLVRSMVERNMRAAVEAGVITLAGLADLGKKELPARFGGKETTCLSARRAVLANQG